MVISCQLEGNGAGQKIPPASVITPPNNVPVSTIIASEKSGYLRVKSMGVVSSNRYSELRIGTSGIVRELAVSNQSYVKRGQLILKLEDAEPKIALRKAEAALAEAQLQFRNDSLGFSLQSMPADEREELIENLKIGSGLRSSEVLVDEARVVLEQSRIVAPFAGVIANLELNKGDFISSQSPICVIYDRQALEVKCGILETDIKHIAVGQGVDIIPVYDSEITIFGKVKEINPLVDEQGLIQVKVSINEPKGLLPGMGVVVEFKAKIEDGVILPLSALVEKENKYVVFTVKDRRSVWNYITISRQLGDSVLVTKGVVPGDSVVVGNNLILAHDTPVSPNND